MRSVRRSFLGGTFFDSDEPAASPSDAGEPGVRRGNEDERCHRAMEGWPGARQRRAFREVAPAVERGCRGECVDAVREPLARVFAEIREDVDEGVADGARRGEGAAVPAIGPETAAAWHE